MIQSTRESIKSLKVLQKKSCAMKAQTGIEYKTSTNKEMEFLFNLKSIEIFSSENLLV